jgi:hypothetical protein
MKKSKSIKRRSTAMVDNLFNAEEMINKLRVRKFREVGRISIAESSKGYIISYIS